MTSKLERRLFLSLRALRERQKKPLIRPLPRARGTFQQVPRSLAVDAYEQCVHRDRAIAAGNNRIHVNFREAPF